MPGSSYPTIPRIVAAAARKRLAGFPILTITGPRQSGKTTLSRLLAPNLPYFSLEDPDTRFLATEDPRAFLRQVADGAILDEVQRAPELFSYLQGVVDADRRMGRFILTGSSQFELTESITQSLAGRVSMLTLMPFSLAELVSDLRNMILATRQSVARGVNAALVMLYWKVGDRIRRNVLHGKRATYGSEILPTLSSKLVPEFGQGFGPRNLARIIDQIRHLLRMPFSETEIQPEDSVSPHAPTNSGCQDKGPMNSELSIQAQNGHCGWQVGFP
jgi:predicted AAA+ superfamily ATPase